MFPWKPIVYVKVGHLKAVRKDGERTFRGSWRPKEGRIEAAVPTRELEPDKIRQSVLEVGNTALQLLKMKAALSRQCPPSNGAGRLDRRTRRVCLCYQQRVMENWAG